MTKQRQTRSRSSDRKAATHRSQRLGLFAAIQPGSDEQRRFDAIVHEIKAEMLGGDDVLPLLYSFARSQIFLDRVRALRDAREDKAMRGGSRGPTSVASLIEGIEHCKALIQVKGAHDRPYASGPPFPAALRYVLETDEPLAKGLEGLTAEDGFLRQLARYERRALGQRRKAIEQITGYEISRRFVGQTD